MCVVHVVLWVPCCCVCVLCCEFCSVLYVVLCVVYRVRAHSLRAARVLHLSPVPVLPSPRLPSCPHIRSEGSACEILNAHHKPHTKPWSCGRQVMAFRDRPLSLPGCTRSQHAASRRPARTVSASFQCASQCNW